jgi:hypothetical protein
LDGPNTLLVPTLDATLELFLSQSLAEEKNPLRVRFPTAVTSQLVKRSSRGRHLVVCRDVRLVDPTDCETSVAYG